MIENEGCEPGGEVDSKVAIFSLLPLFVVMYCFYFGKPNIYVNLVLLLILVFLIIRYRDKLFKKHERLLFEINDSEISHHFYPSQQAESIDLSKVSLVKYGKDFIAFEGDKYYAKEIFFPKKYRNRIPEVVEELNKQYTELKFVKMA